MKSHLNKCKLVIFDIGKTIYDKEKQDKISDDFIKTIELLKKQNIKCGVCTMRTYDWCKKMIKTPLDFYICLNGTYIIVENKVIVNKSIKNNFINQSLLTYGVRNCYYNNYKTKLLSNKLGFLANKPGNIKFPHIITLFNCDKEVYLDYKNKYTAYYWEKDKTINLQNKSTSNLFGVNKIKQYYNLKDCLYFGDGPNDIEIFKNNKYSIMVKNGLPDLKKYAYDVCDECINNGVGKYLDQYYDLKE